MMREGLRRAIEERGDAEVIAEAGDGERAVQLVRDMLPDVVVMDVGLPKMNGLEATRQIKTEFPNVAVIGFSVSEGSRARPPCGLWEHAPISQKPVLSKPFARRCAVCLSETRSIDAKLRSYS